MATKQSQQSRDSESKQAPREGSRRRHGKSSTSRGARRNMNLGSIELDELKMASTLVPMGYTSKRSVDYDYDALSTAAPSSAEQSPELAVMASEVEAWPPLPQAVEAGWDFCSEGSGMEEMWEDLPEPALAMEETTPQSDAGSCAQTKTSWWLVAESDAPEVVTTKAALQETEEVASKPTFADLLRDTQSSQAASVLPPAAGTVMPPLAAPRRSGLATESANGKDETSVDEDSEIHATRQHGWRKYDKAPRNTNYQRKVAEKAAGRQSQSRESRGCLEEDDQDEA